MFLRREHPSQDLQEAREGVSGGQAFWAEGTAGAKALRQDRVRTSPGGRPAGPGRESRGRGVRPACRPPRALQLPPGKTGARDRESTGGLGLPVATACWLLEEDGLGWGRVGTGRLRPGRRRWPRAPRFSSRAGSSGLAPSPPPSCTPAQASARSESPASAPPGKARPSGKRRSETANPTITDKMDSSPDRVQEIRSLLLPGLITASRAAALAAKEIPAACKAGLSAPSSLLSEAFNLPEIITHLLPQEAGDRPAPSPGAGNSEPASAIVGRHLGCSHQGRRRLGSLRVWASAGPNAALCWAGVSASSSVKWFCDTCRVQSG